VIKSGPLVALLYHSVSISNYQWDKWLPFYVDIVPRKGVCVCIMRSILKTSLWRANFLNSSSRLRRPRTTISFKNSLL